MRLLSQLLLTLSILFFLSCDKKVTIDTNQISQQEQDQLKYTIIRYAGRAPEKLGFNGNKFDQKWDDHYIEMAGLHTLEAYHKDDKDYEYLLLSRIAPSRLEKKVAIGIKLKRKPDDNRTIEYYEEVFRTWKFLVPEMQEKGKMLFTLMIQGESLEKYYPQNSGSEEFIEFPDELTYYDKDKKEWISQREVVDAINKEKAKILDSSSTEDTTIVE